jgi:bifunctional non-homologous end joining protein LigD
MPATGPSKSELLSRYRAKRSLDRTPEPSGVVDGGEGRLFVVHKHAATRLHYDLRLEMDGVLRSWAVPKGPSRNPADKRLAVHVEDHPLEYGDFEGVIPEGNYGAGAVIVWDRGEWVPIGDVHEGLEKGKLLFDLKGYKLKGRWTLVKIKKGVKEWLLIKERDGYVGMNGDEWEQGSVLSGLKVEELKGSRDPAAPVRDELKKLGAPKRAVLAKDVELMLAETCEAPFTKDGWVFELKLDGYRVLAAREHGVAKLLSRNGHDITATFPEVARAVEALPYDGLVLDGEMVVHDASGKPSFQRLQQRAQLGRAIDVRHGSVELPAQLYVFDLVACEGFDARPLPLTARKSALQKLLPAAGALRFLEHFVTEGERLYDHVVQLGLEGVVGKRADAPYKGGRSDQWLKVRVDRTDDFVVVGFSRPKGSRSGFGALHLAQYENGELTYAGRVGSGFTDNQLKDVSASLEEHVRKTPPCGGPVPRSKEGTWVEPRLVCEVRFKEWTAEALLRQPVFVRFRDDKEPKECVRPVLGAGGQVLGENEPRRRAASGAPPTPNTQNPVPSFTLSNLDKVFWPAEGYTKGDLIAYYRDIAAWLVPYLEDRPVVLTRYPDGIEGKSFFQKDAPEYAHDFVRTVTMWSAESQRELNYFVCESPESLLYIANMGAIPLHIWASRVATLETPDWCILDLDPKGAPFTYVVEVARACHALCEEIGLPSFVKTSGSSGLHVLIPLGRQCTYEQARTLGGLLARAVAAELPDIATIVRQVTKREGKVYLDYVQNGHGRLLAAPFSARPVPGALVSAPLEWKEVTPKLKLAAFTIKTMPARMKKLKEDPLRPVLALKPDLPHALEQLHGRFTRTKAKR